MNCIYLPVTIFCTHKVTAASLLLKDITEPPGFQPRHFIPVTGLLANGWPASHFRKDYKLRPNNFLKYKSRNLWPLKWTGRFPSGLSSASTHSDLLLVFFGFRASVCIRNGLINKNSLASFLFLGSGNLALSFLQILTATGCECCPL